MATLPDESEESTETAHVFGEDAILEHAPVTRTFTVRTISPCRLICVHRAKFGPMLALLPELKAQLRRFNMLKKELKSAMQERPPDIVTLRRESAAATKIQAGARGSITRRRVRRIRHEQQRQREAKEKAGRRHSSVSSSREGSQPASQLASPSPHQRGRDGRFERVGGETTPSSTPPRPAPMPSPIKSS